MGNIIGVVMEGEETLFHIEGNPITDHDTLCGIDADDPEIGHLGTIQAPKNQKANCWQCRDIFEFVQPLKRSDFE